MLRAGIAVAVAIAGATLVARGWATTTDRAAARRSAAAFLEAVRDGDGLRARQLMHDAELGELDGLEWSSDPGTRVAVLNVRASGPEMVAETELERSGFTISPTLRLRRSSDGVWRVSRISDLGVDRRWVDRFEASLEEGDRALTEELRDRVGQYRRELGRR